MGAVLIHIFSDFSVRRMRCLGGLDVAHGPPFAAPFIMGLCVHVKHLNILLSPVLPVFDKPEVLERPLGGSCSAELESCDS